ncbi:MAG: amidohydrolase family protein [Planctomycetota bacterium]
MRLDSQLNVPLALLSLTLWAGAAATQEPSPPPAPDAPAADPAPDNAAPADPERSAEGTAEPEPEPRRRGRRRAPAIAVRAGHVHPVAGPALTDGVVVFEGQRITAVAAFADAAIPDGAEVVHFPDAHVYPGLVDASTTAYLDDAARGGGGLDAGAELARALLRRHDREDQLVRAGITTAYVRAGGGTGWNGIGAVVRPKRTGFTVFPEHDRAALEVALAADGQRSHALDRQKTIDAAFKAFDAIDAYRKALEEHEEAVEKYEKEFAEYLEFHEKQKKDKPGDAKPADGKPADGKDAPEGGAPSDGAGEGGGEPRRGRRGRRPAPPEKDGALAQQDPQPAKPDAQGQDPKGPGGAPAKADETKGAEGNKDKGPKRPTYPKPPDRDPEKDALLAVLDGKLPLRAEVRRPDEIRRVLQLARQHEVPVLVLEDVLGGAELAHELVQAAVPCVLGDLWPQPRPEAFADYDPATLPRALQDAGVAFAIASGDGRRADALPMLAALAVGGGLDEDAALRAITLTPAEILGVQAETGSLQRGKLADLLVCSGPLFSSDSRVLAVWSAGRRQDDQNPDATPTGEGR